MVTSQRRLTSLTLSLALLGTLFVGVPAQRVAAVGDPIYRIAVIAEGEVDGSYTVPSGNPDSFTLNDIASEYGLSVALLLQANSGIGWGDCNSDGDITGTGDYDWPTVTEARNGSATTFALCGDEVIQFPKLIEGATISVVAGAGSGATVNAWSGTSMTSSITGASGTFNWDRTDYFGDIADPDSDSSPFEDTEMAGTKVVAWHRAMASLRRT